MRPDPYRPRRLKNLDFDQSMLVSIDPTMPAGIAEIRDPDGRTVASIENIGFGNATAAQVGEQELEQR